MSVYLLFSYTVPLATFNTKLYSGHEPWNSICRSCEAHKYKHSLDNVTCIACPAKSFIRNDSTFAYSVDACRCAKGRRPAPRSENVSETQLQESSGFQTPYWPGKLVCVTVLEQETVEIVVSVMSNVVTSVVALQIVASISTTVAASVSTTVGASLSSGVGSSTSLSQNPSGSMALITQVSHSLNIR